MLEHHLFYLELCTPDVDDCVSTSCDVTASDWSCTCRSFIFHVKKNKKTKKKLRTEPNRFDVCVGLKKKTIKKERKLTISLSWLVFHRSENAQKLSELR